MRMMMKMMRMRRTMIFPEAFLMRSFLTMPPAVLAVVAPDPRWLGHNWLESKKLLRTRTWIHICMYLYNINVYYVCIYVWIECVNMYTSVCMNEDTSLRGHVYMLMSSYVCSWLACLVDLYLGRTNAKSNVVRNWQKQIVERFTDVTTRSWQCQRTHTRNVIPRQILARRRNETSNIYIYIYTFIYIHIHT